MTTRIGNRFALSRIASVAMAETRLAARATPSVVRRLAPIVAWAAVAIGLGVLVAFAAVVLPPMGAFGIVAVVAVVLLWAMPEAPLAYPALIRKAFLVMLVVNLCVPYYYMIQVGDLPWISARRITAFALIAPFLLALASSSEIRRRVVDRARSSPLIIICVAGYLITAVLSLPESPLFAESLSALVDSVLTWYVPFLAMVFMVEDETDVIFILKIICFCALFNTAAGVLEFAFHHRFFVDIFPKSMLASIIENNPSLAALTGDGSDIYGFRGFRAASTFVVSLSFAEFEIIAVPIGLFFALHRENLFERCLGWALAIGGIAGITDMSESGAVAGVLACSFIAFATYRLVLSQRENNGLIFCLLGIVVFLNYEYARKPAKEPRSYRAQRRSYSHPDERGLEAA